MKKIFAMLLALAICLSLVSAQASETPYVHFKKDTYNINAGKTITLAPQRVGKTGELKYQWSSSDETVATVNKEGVVKGIGTGTTTISIVGTNKKGEKYTASCTVNVVVPIKSIKVEEKEITICPYQKYVPVITIEPENATVQSIEWKSSNEEKVKVDENGIIRGVNFGKATVTGKATDGSDKTVKISVTVDNVSSKNIVIDSPEGAYLYYCFGSGILMIDQEGDCFESDREWTVNDSYHLLPVKEGKGAIIFQHNFTKKVKVNVTVKKSALPTE